ncbi:MAG: flagellar biosynthesis anti-sigma factor FlgM [Planctomycetes bacterium]|nr:flagellar biosynthesis anti-sigma factor FlgM [Planctomycetota bacterium]
MARLRPAPGAEPAPVRAEEAKGPDGIRHELVARVRQQIADGTYDTEEKWLLAEEALLRRICG